MDNIGSLEKEIRVLKSSLEELSLLNEIAIATGSSMNTNDVLETIVQKSVRAVKAEQGSIKMVTSQKDEMLRTLIRKEDVSIIESYSVGSHIIGWVLKNRMPLIINDLATDNRFKTTDKDKKAIRTVLCVPINFRGEIIGVLTLLNKKTFEPFTENDKRLISIIATQSGQIIRNSQLQEEALERTRLQQELDIARRIQYSLVPDKDPNVKGLNIAHYFNPADNVGGDYFDYFNISDSRIGIVMADVSGHGPSAALMMTMIKGVFHSIMAHFTAANEALSEINAILARILPPEMFVTILLLEIDLQNKIIYFSNAGHNPFFYYNDSLGEIQLIEKPGYAINLHPSPTFSIEKIDLHNNDMIFIYTDGLTEAVNDKTEMFGVNGVLEKLNALINEPASEIIQRLKKELYTFTGDLKPGDDVAMIAIKLNID